MTDLTQNAPIDAVVMAIVDDVKNRLWKSRT